MAPVGSPRPYGRNNQWGRRSPRDLLGLPQPVIWDRHNPWARSSSLDRRGIAASRGVAMEPETASVARAFEGALLEAARRDPQHLISPLGRLGWCSAKLDAILRARLKTRSLRRRSPRWPQRRPGATRRPSRGGGAARRSRRGRKRRGKARAQRGRSAKRSAGPMADRCAPSTPQLRSCLDGGPSTQRLGP